MSLPRFAIAFVLAAACCPLGAEPLVLHYFERPPFYYSLPNGQPAGLVVDRLRRALALSGLPYRWQQTPSNRQLAQIEADSGADCIVGWFRTAERERIGRFSAPLYRDRPQVAIVNESLPLDGPPAVARLLAERNGIFLRRERFSYGHALDALLAAKKPREMATSVPIADMVRMVGAGRAAYTFVSAEEAETLKLDGARAVTLADMPAGETRHLLCSRHVPADTLARLDAALLKLGE
ncbi:substrate-binding periplasmic protein [Crenobacter cavernae]|uniref:Solute-binding protein family 3/N-terminal domain-containing protein n=1 Tax=Crenobacter cavernae TaxID=2290923 RepID=A0A345Y465_9NEIS|nr:transporter substrate-binding domain-containing protein [Crenobacter cavernae]AXK38717.1 hypothetical protein DWG20_04335 [Crenobacter cavernae]